ncbi:MAG: amino acid-binding protein [Armatimonadota bacterium]|nr:MAG: amino acid-binding protein [Armatimonadota bacterium]
MKEFIVSVMAKDRPGIVAAVSGAVASLGGNITHLSQTVLRGYFTIILSLEASDSLDAETLRETIAASGAPGEFQVGAAPFEDSVAWHPDRPQERFVLTARCRDRSGIIHRISRTLAEASINIDDFYAYVLDGDLIMILELGVPPGVSVPEIQKDLQRLAEEEGIVAHLQHEDIFRATTELQAVLRLGDRR